MEQSSRKVYEKFGSENGMNYTAVPDKVWKFNCFTSQLGYSKMIKSVLNVASVCIMGLI